MRRSGLSRIEIERRIALQMDEEARERADFTVNNSGDLNALHQQAASLWAQISETPMSTVSGALRETPLLLLIGQQRTTGRICRLEDASPIRRNRC